MDALSALTDPICLPPPVLGGGLSDLIVCWDKLAETAGQFLSRGRLVCVVGRLTYRTWETRDGQRRTTAEVVAAELVLLDRRPDGEPNEPSDEPGDARAA